jgi:hypothetical protein
MCVELIERRRREDLLRKYGLGPELGLDKDNTGKKRGSPGEGKYSDYEEEYEGTVGFANWR